ncbi:hypothetical protein OROGR_030123 [Orobanche gracilis]
MTWSEGGQMQTFTASSFQGNDGLCGFLSNKNCTSSSPLPDSGFVSARDITDRICGAPRVIYGSIFCNKKWRPCLLNSDGSFMRNGSAGAGFIIRDSAGRTLIAKANPVKVTDSLEAEATALVIGLEAAYFVDYNRVLVEMDALVLLKIIKKEFKVPWNLTMVIRAIWAIQRWEATS